VAGSFAKLPDGVDKTALTVTNHVA